MHYYKQTVFISLPDCLWGESELKPSCCRQSELILGDYCGTILALQKKKQTKKITSCNPSQTPWIIIAEKNWHIEVTVVKLVLLWVTAAPGRFRSVKSHCMLKSFWHEFRTQSSVYPNFLSVCVASLPWPRQRNVLFSCRTLVLPLWKLGCCVNGLSRMDLVNASLRSMTIPVLMIISMSVIIWAKESTNIFVLFCVMYIYAFLCN